jgi:hypothetical protein
MHFILWYSFWKLAQKITSIWHSFNPGCNDQPNALKITIFIMHSILWFLFKTLVKKLTLHMIYMEHWFEQSTKCFLNNAQHDAFYYLIFILKISSKITSIWLSFNPGCNDQPNALKITIFIMHSIIWFLF